MSQGLGRTRREGFLPETMTCPPADLSTCPPGAELPLAPPGHSLQQELSALATPGEGWGSSDEKGSDAKCPIDCPEGEERG